MSSAKWFLYVLGTAVPEEGAYLSEEVATAPFGGSDQQHLLGQLLVFC